MKANWMESQIEALVQPDLNVIPEIARTCDCLTYSNGFNKIN
jgi:hypothetical protein